MYKQRIPMNITYRYLHLFMEHILFPCEMNIYDLPAFPPFPSPTPPLYFPSLCDLSFDDILYE